MKKQPSGCFPLYDYSNNQYIDYWKFMNRINAKLNDFLLLYKGSKVKRQSR